MKIIIAGAGEVGTHLAKLLSKEEQDIILIDADIEKLQWIDSNYNLMTVAGSPTSFKVLKRLGLTTQIYLLPLCHSNLEILRHVHWLLN